MKASVLAIAGVSLAAVMPNPEPMRKALPRGHLADAINERAVPPQPIVGGTPVPSATTFPWSALVSLGGTDFCGGIILSPTKILTAGHCCSEPLNKYQVRVGAITFDRGGQTRTVKSVVAHPKWNTKTLDYDTGILTLSLPLTLSPASQPGTLVSSGTDVAENQTLTIIGWGATETFGERSDILLQTNINGVSRDTCRVEYGYKTITPRMFCAAAPGKDTCSGDSGGAIMDAATKTLVGSTSWGHGCAEPNFAGVYTDYADPEIHSWILDQLAQP